MQGRSFYMLNWSIRDREDVAELGAPANAGELQGRITLHTTYSFGANPGDRSLMLRFFGSNS
jgi:hypothetical protein